MQTHMRALRSVVLLLIVAFSSGQFLPEQVRACAIDSNCQQYGDVNATCARDSGLCLCGVAHGSFKALLPSGVENHYYSCFKDSTQDVNADEIVDLLLSVVFSSGSCLSEDEFGTPFIALVESILQNTRSTIISIAHSCAIQNIPDPPVTKRPTPVPTSTEAPVPGVGVYTSIRLSARVSDLFTDALINFDTNLLKSVGFGSLEKLGTAVSFYQVMESQSAATRCPIVWEGARVMSYFGNGASCRPASCKTGYRLEPLDAHCRLPPTPPPSTSSDDTLTKGAIAGIAVGSFVFVAVVVFLVYCLCFREPEIIIIEEETEEEEMVTGNAPDEDDEDLM